MSIALHIACAKMSAICSALRLLCELLMWPFSTFVFSFLTSTHFELIFGDDVSLFLDTDLIHELSFFHFGASQSFGFLCASYLCVVRVETREKRV